MIRGGWWTQQCPARGPGLSHAHWSHCNPDSGHPHDESGNEGNHHGWDMCCSCEMTAATEAAAKPSQPAIERALEEHAYVFTIMGRCQRCGRTSPEHIQIDHAVPPGKCPVRHDSITQKGLSIGDEGLQWKTCPSCLTQIEPRMSLGEPQGRADGIGRGWVSPRMRRRWENIAREMRPS